MNKKQLEIPICTLIAFLSVIAGVILWETFEYPFDIIPILLVALPMAYFFWKVFPRGIKIKWKRRKE